MDSGYITATFKVGLENKWSEKKIFPSGRAVGSVLGHPLCVQGK